MIVRQFDSLADSRAIRTEYCIVGIPHNTAIYFSTETAFSFSVVKSHNALKHITILSAFCQRSVINILFKNIIFEVLLGEIVSVLYGLIQ